MGSEDSLITRDAGIMGGKACVAGTRVTVGMIVSQLGAGHSIEEVIELYPYLRREHILAALRYAADVVAHERTDDDTDRDGDTRIANGADYIELFPT